MRWPWRRAAGAAPTSYFSGDMDTRTPDLVARTEVAVDELNKIAERLERTASALEKMERRRGQG